MGPLQHHLTEPGRHDNLQYGVPNKLIPMQHPLPHQQSLKQKITMRGILYLMCGQCNVKQPIQGRICTLLTL